MQHPEVKSAIKTAKEFLAEVMTDAKDVRFEGVEMDPEVKDSWLLTFSVYRDQVVSKVEERMSLLGGKRLEKSFVNVTVDSDLKVHSVKPSLQ